MKIGQPGDFYGGTFLLGFVVVVVVDESTLQDVRDT